MASYPPAPPENMITEERLKLARTLYQMKKTNPAKYPIVNDLHTPALFGDMLPSKKLCKHLGKLLLTLDKEKATTLLRQIYVNKESWNFKPYTQ